MKRTIKLHTGATKVVDSIRRRQYLPATDRRFPSLQEG